MPRFSPELTAQGSHYPMPGGTLNLLLALLERQHTACDPPVSVASEVLLAERISTHCHFCSESAPFFRQLSGKAGKAFKIVAVLPQPLSESREYLTQERVRVDQVKVLPLGQLGIVGTPTMLLLDNHGTVTKEWVGKLNPEQQSKALKIIVAG